MTSKLKIFPLFILNPSSRVFADPYGLHSRPRLRPGGLPVPEARVTITEVSTIQYRRPLLNEGGNLFGQLLKLGISGRGERAGFKATVQEPTRLVLNHPLLPTSKMELGPVSETVEVSQHNKLNYVHRNRTRG